MNLRNYRPHLAVIALMGITALALHFGVDAKVAPQGDIALHLPDRVGAWSGEELRYCQDLDCLRQWTGPQIPPSGLCPSCNGRLDAMSRAERDLLPADTQIVRKLYRGPRQQGLLVTIVWSGAERASIHRPEVCLISQGHTIRTQRLLSVPLAGRADLRLMALDTEWEQKTPSGPGTRGQTFFAYWFIGRGRETPSHAERLLWSTFDRVFRRAAHRWAYVSIVTDRGANDEDNPALRVSGFVRDLYPALRPAAPPSAQ